MSDTEWMDQALCAQCDPEEFFPPPGPPLLAVMHVCRACPVRLACLEYALTHRMDHGVWGGTTASDRQDMKRPRKTTSATPSRCPRCDRAFASRVGVATHMTRTHGRQTAS